LLSVLVQLDFFLGNLNDSGLTIQVYSRGPGLYITGAIGDITLNAYSASGLMPSTIQAWLLMLGWQNRRASLTSGSS